MVGGKEAASGRGSSTGAKRNGHEGNSLCTGYYENDIQSNKGGAEIRAGAVSGGDVGQWKHPRECRNKENRAHLGKAEWK